MAYTANTAPATAGNPLATILDEAAEVQTLASRAGHLALAMSKMAESVCGHHLSRHDSDAVRGIVAFADMAGELAEKIAETGERIEMAANAAQRV